MIRLPVRTQDPVRTAPDVPNVSYEQKRVTLNLAYNAGQYVGPPGGYYWVIDAIQFELQCSVNVGARYCYIYFRDKNGKLMRHRVIEGVAGNIYWHICTPYASVSRDEGGGPSLSSSPLYVQTIQYPCAYGFLQTNFDGGTDVITVHLMVREYKE